MTWTHSPWLGWQHHGQHHQLFCGLVNIGFEVSLQASCQPTCLDQARKLLAVILLSRDPALKVPFLVVAHQIIDSLLRHDLFDLLKILHSNMQVIFNLEDMIQVSIISSMFAKAFESTAGEHSCKSMKEFSASHLCNFAHKLTSLDMLKWARTSGGRWSRSLDLATCHPTHWTKSAIQLCYSRHGYNDTHQACTPR